MIPREDKKIITVDRLRLIDAMRRAQLISSKTHGVKVAASKEGVTITSDNPDLGEIREELEIAFNADPIAIGFNPYRRPRRRSCSCSRDDIAIASS